MRPFGEKKPHEPQLVWGQEGGAEHIAALTYPTPIERVVLEVPGGCDPQPLAQALMQTGRFASVDSGGHGFRVQIQATGQEVRINLLAPEGRTLESHAFSSSVDPALECIKELATPQRFLELTGREHPLLPKGLNALVIACGMNGQPEALHFWAQRLATVAHISGDPSLWFRAGELLSYNGDIAGARAALARAAAAGASPESVEARTFGLDVLERCGREVFAMLLLHGMMAHAEELQHALGAQPSHEERCECALAQRILGRMLERAGMGRQPEEFRERLRAHFGHEAPVLWKVPFLVDLACNGRLDFGEIYGALLTSLPLLYLVYPGAHELRQHADPEMLARATQRMFVSNPLNPQGAETPEQKQHSGDLANAQLLLDFGRPDIALERVHTYLKTVTPSVDALLLLAEIQHALNQDTTKALDEAAKLGPRPNEAQWLRLLRESFQSQTGTVDRA